MYLNHIVLQEAEEERPDLKFTKKRGRKPESFGKHKQKKFKKNKYSYPH